MPIPDYQSLMLPLLRFASGGEEHRFADAVDALAAELGVSAEERKEFLHSGSYPVFRNRVGWAGTYLRKAGLLESTRRGFFRVTARGVAALGSNPKKIDVGYLERFPSLVEFKNRSAKPVASPEALPAQEEQTPEEAIESAYQQIRTQLAADLLQQIMSCSPAFFERLVVELLVRMGYGGSRRDAGRAIGGSGDGGIDGIIKEDRLGLDVVYIQAKRWEGTVGRPEIQKFVGALQGQRARKGIFITTSTFSADAEHYASMIDTKVVLIDGASLASYMIDHDVGVAPAAAYEIKRVDSDYFVDA